jgi:hypothetical protein
VMVEKIEAFRTELQIDLLMYGEDLADSRIEGPCARSAEAVGGNHGRSERALVGDSIQCRISAGDGWRKVANDIAVRSTAILTLRD